MLHQTFLFLGQLWQLFEVSQLLEFLRYIWLPVRAPLYMLSVSYYILGDFDDPVSHANKTAGPLAISTLQY